MLYKIDKNGSVINEANLNKINRYCKKALEEINNNLQRKFNKNLVSFYVRGSVSTGKFKPFISDLDTVAITRYKLPKKELLWTAKFSKLLEKKYPKIYGIELIVVSLSELLKSKKYLALRINLKVESICLWGKDILSRLPKIEVGKVLTLKLYQNIIRELNDLKKIFLKNKNNPTYLYRRKPIKFWCTWTMRTILRSSLGLIMIKKPVYSQDLKTCFQLFTKNYPEFKKEMTKIISWAIKPTSNKVRVYNFLKVFIPKYSKLWQKALKRIKI